MDNISQVMLECSSNFDTVNAAALQIYRFKPYFFIKVWHWIHFYFILVSECET